ncbi:MAG: DNA-processing protein DprA [Rhizobiaceae bacterium]|nr:DNA-processing protein DprA [Rhizobiaceae bacterium]
MIRSENVGPATFRDLINHFGTASSALDALPELSNRAGKKSIKICPRPRAENEMEAADRLDIEYIGMGEAKYPRYLRAIDYPPPLLSVRGRLDMNKNPTLGMVGARNSSLSGLKLATKFASELGEIPYTIVSGFARGIDAAAHRATLGSGTISVLAGGVDVIFPPEHGDFYTQMLESGNVFVSEMPLSYRPRAIDFPRRNRIIAGISLGVVVIEAAKRSGSLITARLANEAGRLVFAVPGSPLDPRSAGANSLLKNGALIASDPADIVEAISPLLDEHAHGAAFETKKHSLEDGEAVDKEDFSPSEIITDTNHRQLIMQALGPTPTDVDELVRHCRLPVSHIQLVLIELSLAGRLERHPGNMVSLLMDG